MPDAITRRLAAFAATHPSAAIPERARQAASHCLLDTLACGLAGIAVPSSQDAAAVISSE